MVFISLLDPNDLNASPDPNTKDNEKDVFDVHFFAGSYAPVICSHGMFAATKATCCKFLPGLDWGPSTCVVRFRTGEGTLVASRIVPGAHSPLEHTKSIYRQTCSWRLMLSRSVENLDIQDIAHGSGAMRKYLVVVVKEGTDLEGMQADIPVLVSSVQVISTGAEADRTERNCSLLKYSCHPYAQQTYHLGLKDVRTPEWYYGRSYYRFYSHLALGILDGTVGQG
ncbi:hypothetical protein BS17DRAFT_805333 [Gyrodon lividus]|nr:hypothetical protein BS17DRAFT_805333 [Gyrodon lividus]